ncbi:hypothetical protein AC249_AIPGENE24005 [Exaiptasia diaphana]|nr:hypothetical protein AC249_AIPGENE24005 [Exaiptasia diaphana]
MIESIESIENCLSNKLPILAQANYIRTYAGSETTKDSSKECEQSSTEEKPTIKIQFFNYNTQTVVTYEYEDRMAL